MKTCDNTSVGAIITNDAEEVLLIERKKFPFGLAAPAGHIDAFVSPEEAIKQEVLEEVGLQVSSLHLLKGNVCKENPCRREGGDHHTWWVYEVDATGILTPSDSETKGARWYSLDEVHSLAQRTESYTKGLISEEAWQARPGLEPIWYDWFRELQII